MEAPKNLHLTIPKTGSKSDQNYVDGYAFFMCIAAQSHRKIPKGPKFRILKFLIRQKRVRFIFLFG